MPISEARSAAARSNGAKSRGPVTPKAKPAPHKIRGVTESSPVRSRSAPKVRSAVQPRAAIPRRMAARRPHRTESRRRNGLCRFRQSRIVSVEVAAWDLHGQRRCRHRRRIRRAAGQRRPRRHRLPEPRQQYPHARSHQPLRDALPPPVHACAQRAEGLAGPPAPRGLSSGARCSRPGRRIAKRSQRDHARGRRATRRGRFAKRTQDTRPLVPAEKANMPNELASHPDDGPAFTCFSRTRSKHDRVN